MAAVAERVRRRGRDRRRGEARADRHDAVPIEVDFRAAPGGRARRGAGGVVGVRPRPHGTARDGSGMARHEEELAGREGRRESGVATA